MKHLPYIICLICIYSCSNKTVAITENNTHENIDFLQTLDNKVPHLQLATPQISIDSFLFLNQASIELDLAYPDAKLFYYINAQQKQEYTNALKIDSSCTITYYAKANGFVSSDKKSVELLKINKDISGANVSFPFPADAAYPGEGPNSLIDHKKGSINFREGNFWSGFNTDGVIIILDLEKAIPMETVQLSLLKDHGSWIFLPEKITVKNAKHVIGTRTLSPATEQEDAHLAFIEIPVEEGTYQHLEIFIKNLKAIPDWHPGSGTDPWLFIDEILVE